MGKFIAIAEMQSLKAGTKIYQLEGTRLDVSGVDELMVTFRAAGAGTNSPVISLETADALDSVEWLESANFAPAGAGSEVAILKREENRTTGFLKNFLRWTADGTGTYEVTFSIVGLVLR